VLTGGLSLKELFVAYSVEWGVYALRFFIEGDWYLCVIDDYIPCDANKKPIYGHNKSNDEFWVMILEKAFACMYGTYEGIHFGYEHYAMESLTGGVVAEVEIGVTDEKAQLAVFKTLKERVENGDAFAVATKEVEKKKGAELKEEKRADGLISGHAYGLMGLVDAEGHQLLQLRNPWGSDEWKGAWSTGSKEWTPSMKTACKEGAEHDQGTFWISRKDFFQNFGSCQGVRNFDKDYKCTATYSSIAGDNQKTQDVSFAVVPETKANEVIFVLAQRDARKRSGGKNDEYEIELSFDLYRVDNNPDAVQQEDVDIEPPPVLMYSAPFNAARSISATVALNPQHGYYIVPHVRIPKKLKDKKKHVCVFLRCYSKTKVEVDEMGYKEDLDEEEEDDEEDEDDEECKDCEKKDKKIEELEEKIKALKLKVKELNEE